MLFYQSVKQKIFLGNSLVILLFYIELTGNHLQRKLIGFVNVLNANSTL